MIPELMGRILLSTMSLSPDLVSRARLPPFLQRKTWTKFASSGAGSHDKQPEPRSLLSNLGFGSREKAQAKCRSAQRWDMGTSRGMRRCLYLGYIHPHQLHVSPTRLRRTRLTHRWVFRGTFAPTANLGFYLILDRALDYSSGSPGGPPVTLRLLFTPLKLALRAGWN